MAVLGFGQCPHIALGIHPQLLCFPAISVAGLVSISFGLSRFAAVPRVLTHSAQDVNKLLHMQTML